MPPRSTSSLDGFYRGLASLLRAGVILGDALAALRKDGKLTGDFGEDLERRVGQGATLSTAMAEHRDRFAAEEIALVQAGEASGRLDSVLDKLADLDVQRRRNRRRLWTQATYPLLLIHLGVATLPFARLSVQGRFTFGAWLVSVALILAPLYGGYFLVRRLNRSASGRTRLRRLVEHIPGFGNAARHRRRAVFAAVMEAAYGAGMSMDRCIQLAGAAANLPVEGAAKQVAEGSEVALSLGNVRVLPAGALARLATGEHAGELSSALQSIAREEAEEASAILERSLNLTGKAIYLLVAVWIGFEVFGFYADLYRF